MKELILGIDLCDDYTQVSAYDPDKMDAVPLELTSREGSSEMIPTVICKVKGQDIWHVGEDAYRFALFGQGTMVNRLVSLLIKDGTATLEGVKYTAEELGEAFLSRILEGILEGQGESEIVSLTYTLQELNVKVMDMLVMISERMGIARERVHIISHTESFVYYVISQRREVWANETCLFDLNENGLHYYEMRIIRGRKPQVVEANHQELNEGFSLDVLDTEAGCKLADSILTSCAQRLFSKKLFSSVFLCGRGFERSDWASGFLKTACSRRRVFMGQQLFARGAAYVAMDYMRNESAYPFVCLCEGRLRFSVSMKAMYEGQEQQIMLVPAGSNWYEAQVSAEFILDDTHELELIVTPVDRPQVKRLKVQLDSFPARPNKTTKIELILSFPDLDRMSVRVLDKGFGEFFPASYFMVREDFTL